MPRFERGACQLFPLKEYSVTLSNTRWWGGGGGGGGGMGFGGMGRRGEVIREVGKGGILVYERQSLQEVAA